MVPSDPKDLPAAIDHALGRTIAQIERDLHHCAEPTGRERLTKLLGAARALRNAVVSGPLPTSAQMSADPEGAPTDE